jgi:ferritin
MKIIKELSEHIGDEIEGAEEYIKAALKYKDDHPDIARILYEMSMDEMHHMELLHGEVVKLISEHRKTKGEPPAAMLAVYEYLHEKHIEEAAEVRVYQAHFREGK